VNQRRAGEPPAARGGDVRVRITPEEARLLQELILDHCGVRLGSDAGFLFERRLGARLEALGLASFIEYFHYLSYDLDGPAELEECVERITTHETYFFREQFQLDAFRREIIPQLLRQGPAMPSRRRGPSVWSAGCSTGEEAYTIAMLLAEAAPESPGLVIGSDISRKVLASAQQGTYGPASFRTTSDAARDRLFLPAGPGLWRVPPSIRRMCSFVHLNLMDVGRFATLGRLDVIFCRNVLMYLSAPARHRIVEAFYDALVPGGYLLLGHSESLLNVTTRFDLVHLTSDLVYRRPE
jgi:chemotaxis protein methyltransferase CheR